MKVTVLIANYNYGRYIEQAIDSAFNQIYKPIQICVVDDNSTDDSWNIIHKKLFGSNSVRTDSINNIEVKQDIRPDFKLIAIRLPLSSGPSTARNIGIELTKHDTDIYAILDADDKMRPQKIEKLIRKFLYYPEVGVVYGNYNLINEDTNLTLPELKEPYSKRRLWQECIVHSGSLIRKQALLDVIESTGYYDQRLRCAEDYDLWLRISEKYMISHVPEILTDVLVHNNNSTNSVNKEIWQQCWQLVQSKLQSRHQQK